jgi:beta-glucosidase
VLTAGAAVRAHRRGRRALEPVARPPIGTHGLSCTELRYRRLQVTPRSNDGDDRIRIRFDVSNVGPVAGTGIAQIYIELPSSTGEPSRRLVAWERVELRPGQRQRVTIDLARRDLDDMHLLEHWDTGRNRWATGAGTYEVHVGGSSETVLHDEFRVRQHRHRRHRHSPPLTAAASEREIGPLVPACSQGPAGGRG